MRENPIICTLGIGEFTTREAEWHAVLKSAVTAYQETPQGFVFSIAPSEAIRTELQRLAGLESTCCAWMDIAVEDGDPIVLKMTSNSPGGKEVIAMLVPPQARSAKSA